MSKHVLSPPPSGDPDPLQALVAKIERLLTRARIKAEDNPYPDKAADWLDLARSYELYLDWAKIAHDVEVPRIEEAVESVEREFFWNRAADEAEWRSMESIHVEEDTLQSGSQLGSYLWRILQWLEEPYHNFSRSGQKWTDKARGKVHKQVSMRSAVIRYILIPQESRYDSLAALGRDFGLTKAAASKVARSFDDEFGRMSARTMDEAYRQACSARQKRVWEQREKDGDAA